MLSVSHLVLILIIVLILFGSRRIPEIMKDLAQAWKTFHDAMSTPSSGSDMETSHKKSSKNSKVPKSQENSDPSKDL